MTSNDTLALSFKALAHPRRVRIFRLLATTPEAGEFFLYKNTPACAKAHSATIFAKWNGQGCCAAAEKASSPAMS